MLFIVLHHGIIKGTRMYMAVDFFFIVSGFYLAKSYEKEKLSPGRFYLHRIRRLYPYYFFAFSLLAIANRLNHSFLKSGYHPIYEVLMIQNIGFPESGGINYPCWYISVLIYGGMLLYLVMWLLKSKKQSIMVLGIGIISLASYTLLLSLNNNLIEQWGYFHNFLYLPLLRGIADMGVGILFFELNKKRTKSLKMDFSLLLLALIFLLMLTNISSDYAILFFEALIAWLSLSDQTKFLNRIAKQTIFQFLAKYEYSVYLNHALIIKVFEHLNVVGFKKLLLIPVVLLFSIIFKWCVDHLMGLFKAYIMCVIGRNFKKA